MYGIAVTHPDPTSRNPRALSEGGRYQALLAARRIRELVGKRTSLAVVISSPRARCLETAIIVARELGETTREDGTYQGRIDVVQELDETGAEPNVQDNLDAVLATHTSKDLGKDKAVLLAVHGDLANMLSSACTFKEQMASGGWFDVRPVIAGFEYTSQGVRTVKFCEAFQCSSWISCIQDL